jgi:hypothetical protein
MHAIRIQSVKNVKDKHFVIHIHLYGIFYISYLKLSLPLELGLLYMVMMRYEL